MAKDINEIKGWSKLLADGNGKGLRGIDILMIKQRIIDILDIAGVKNPTYCKLTEPSDGVFVFSYLHTSFSKSLVEYLKETLGDVEVNFDHKNKYSMIVTVKGARDVFLSLLPARR
jgi:hypothetical protein